MAPDQKTSTTRRNFITAVGAAVGAAGTGSAVAHVSDDNGSGGNETVNGTGNETWNESGNETGNESSEEIDREDVPVAAVQQGWGEPIEEMSSDFREGDLEGEWSQWGSGDDGEGCYEPSTWNGLRCGSNSDVYSGKHVIEGTVDGKTSGATSTGTFTYARIEWSERANTVATLDEEDAETLRQINGEDPFNVENIEEKETYNVTPIIYPDDPDNLKAGNGEIDVAERRVGEMDPFFCVHWNGDNYHINVEIDGTKWHNYAVEWLPDEIIWYIDGQRVDSFDLSIDMVANFNAGQMDMFPDTGTPMRPTFYEVDWVKFYDYQADGPSPIPENDYPGGRDWEPTNVRSGIGWQGD